MISGKQKRIEHLASKGNRVGLERKQIKCVVLSRPISLYATLTAASPLLPQFVPADQVCDFCEPYRVLSYLYCCFTPPLLQGYNSKQCCKISASALFRIDSLVCGLMWGSKEAYMTTVGAEAVDSNRPLVRNLSPNPLAAIGDRRLKPVAYLSHPMA